MTPLIPELSALGYRFGAKPVLFALHPDHIHDRALHLGHWLGKSALVRTGLSMGYAYHDPLLQQDIAGIDFHNPIGLAAGYDYDGYLPSITGSLGFGWQTVGSVTHGSYPGNTPPLYARLPQSQSLWVNKGFKSSGANAVQQRLVNTKSSLPYGISIGATNQDYNSVDEVLQEYQQAFSTMRSLTNHSYWELNISCPNLKSAFSLYESEPLHQLLSMVDTLHLEKPLFIKLPVDISAQHLAKLLGIIVSHQVTGIILGNLTKKRQHNRALLQTEAAALPEYGGLSGKPTQHLSDHLIGVAHDLVGDQLVIVGCGGIFSAEDVYRKIRQGASLLQLITAMIYKGPQIIGQINRDLAHLLKRDGFTHISEAIGVK